MNLASRSAEAEVMEALPAAEYAEALRDLASVNRLTFTHRPILRWLDRLARQAPSAIPLSVLDVACGHGDLLRAIGRWGAGRAVSMRLDGLDLSDAGIAEARRATPASLGIGFRVGDVFAEDARADIIVTSQFTHHLTDVQVVDFLRWIDGHAVRGWFIADLHRRYVPYFGFRVLARAMLWHHVVRTDGTISVARSFRPQDWKTLLARAGVTAEVRRRFPYRLCVSRIK